MKPKLSIFKKKILSRAGMAALASLVLFSLASTALASTPTLYASASGNSVTLTISSANPSSSVYLYQRQSASNFTTSGSSIGNTDQNGNATLTQTITFDGSSNPVYMYVLIGGIQSPTVLIPPGTCNSSCVSGTLTLSQTSVSLNSPNSVTVIASPSSGSVTVTGNSNSSVANAFTSGDSIIITGQATGSTTVTVCSAVSASQCNTILVTVNGGSSTTLNFNPTNPVVVAGQTSTVAIYSPSNSSSATYYISSNSNSNVVSNPTISGSTLYFSGGVPGSATLSICQTGSSYCGTLTVSVGNNGSGGMSISPSTLTLTAGNTGLATISNSVGNLTISSNSNSSVASASVSNTSGQTTQTVTVYAIAAGSSTLSVCPNGSSSGCVYLYVQVGSSSSNNSSNGVSFSVPNPVMTVGQSQSIAIYSTNGVSTYTISNNTGASIVSLSLSGSSLYLVGQSVGSSTITVCQTASTICGTLYVAVNGSSGGLTFSPSNINVAQNQSQTVAITGGDGTYFVSSNTNPSAAAVSLQGASLYATGLNSGTSSVTVCQSSNSSVCGVIAVTVGGGTSGSGSIIFSNTNPSLAVGQSQSITITGGTSATYYISSISNPSVATVNLTGSVLSITGVAAGSSTLSVCQTGGSICASLTLTVGGTASTTGIYLNGTTLPAGTANAAYSSQVAAAGGAGNYSYTLTGGSLPTGLTLSSGGLISGTPTSAGTSSFTIQATDSSNATATGVFSITINGASMSGSGLTVPTTTPVSTTAPAATPGSLVNGELINEGGTISIVYNGTKTPFANPDAFLGLGFAFSNVENIDNSNLPLSGKIVVTANGAHPRGSWLLSGSTVYFQTPTGMIPVPSWSIFLNNGGQATFLVPANSYDLARAILPLMTDSDSRLHP